MNPIEKQAEIMTELAQLMLDQVEGPYESITCEYEYVERYSTVSSSLSVIQQGRRNIQILRLDMRPTMPSFARSFGG